MNIALCICTRNRPNDLQKALFSVKASSETPSQIIVSDDSDKNLADKTKAVCHDFEHVLYVRGPQRGLSANRNCCLDHLESDIEIVCFIDDDVTLRSEFLGQAIKELMNAPSQTIITGREMSNGIEITPHNISFWGYQEVAPQGDNDYHAIVINSTIFPRTLFDGLRFDEALRYGSEEVDMCASAEAAGYQIQFCPELINDHNSSPINRAEYSQYIEASRLYSTFKRYYWRDRNLLKAIAFAVFAPLHLVGHIIKTRQIGSFSCTITSCLAAARYAQTFARQHNNCSSAVIRHPAKEAI